MADQSVLPSAAAVNTTLTTIALALRTGAHIAAKHFGNASAGLKRVRVASAAH